MASISEVLGGGSGMKGQLLLVAAVVALAGVALKSANRLFPIEHTRPMAKEGERIFPSDWREGSRTGFELQKRGQTWGDAAIRLGLSFGIAMIAGSLLRAFLRTMLTLFIVTGIVLFFLYNHGVIDPFWEDYAAAAGEAKVWAMEQKNHVQQFLKGYVPSAGAALVGFGFGLRK